MGVNGTIVGNCYDGSAYSSFQYTNGTLAPVSLAPLTGYLEDISKDGNVSMEREPAAYAR